MRKSHTLTLIKIAILSLVFGGAAAQTGVRGKVYNQKKEPLPFASVSVKGTSNGTIANEDGLYQLNLQPGNYEIIFQYLGYQTGVKKVTVSNTPETFDAVLAEQALELGELKIGRSKEDPAYAIMRRAIAKSKYHLLQVESYKAKAYTKSSVVITDLPLEFLYKKELDKISKEENFKKGVPILNETVSEIEFKQPNTYKQRVIAARNSQDNTFANPNEYLLTSFYKPEIVQTVSPLSPKAFSYYKFEYLGTFRENGVDVSKIKVTPRAYGDGVFKGTLHIIEDAWAIHSLDLQTVKMGISLKIKQLYAPIQNVWMPIQQQFNVDGGLYGVKGKADYVISQTFQSVKLNPNFPPDIVVLDPKTEKAEIRALPQKNSAGEKQLETLLNGGQKLSAKTLRKAMKQYEKEQVRERKTGGEDVDLIEKRVSTTEVDSLATARNKSYWDSLRTVPLTHSEIVSYKRLDSLVVKRKIENPGPSEPRQPGTPDSTRTGNKKSNAKFSPGKLFFGASFPLGKDKSWRADYFGPVRVPQFNTVEGLVIDGAGLGIRHTRRAKKNSVKTGYQLSLKGLLRYSLERNLLSPRGELQYSRGSNSFLLEGGRTISQFNSENPISYLLNSVTTLFFEQNFAKIYQKDYLKLQFTHAASADHIRFNVYLEYADRMMLDNAAKMNRYRWINWRKREFTDNTPELQQGPAPVRNHLALTLGASLGYKPWQKYRIKNGKTTYYNDDSPEFLLAYRKGVPDLSGSMANFDFLQFRIKHGFDTGIRSKLYYQVGAGRFLNRRQTDFPDYQHFSGNRFFFQLGDPVGTFRMLDYYRFSTDRHFVEGHVLAEFRQLLLTQIQWFRLLGIKETVIAHYLLTPQSRHYTELGYGFDVGIRFPFRIEVMNSFESGKYKHTAFRIGTTMNLPFQQ
ncbi:DUF5686 and carboxypeptidase regulatory-like domain-containing protein [Ravibacter arvi]|uniref:DUF5686 and carboxypeptidase regulatory-like domain-containing protein n=1 Tax=Ravibacter arvi TaxID=2051041 RepID=A0ABP8LXS1_9BACT